MLDDSIKVLLISQDPALAQRVGAILRAGQNGHELTWAPQLAIGKNRLAEGKCDAVLVDLALSRGLDAFFQLWAQGWEVPIIVLTDRDNEQSGRRAIQEGAQDYLNKDEIDEKLLIRSLRYSIDRYRMQLELHSLSFDGLTGLYTRRIFMTLTAEQIKIAKRNNSDLLLIFADLDGLKQINDTHGHLEGDRALIQTSELLKRTFRASDLIARLGGDEFTVLVANAPERHSERIVRRLEHNLKAFNEDQSLVYPLSLSWGVVRYDPATMPTVDAFMSVADAAMYKHKRSQRLAVG